jgi:hypothetical protein
MALLAKLPNLIGFFNYSRADDDKGGGAGTALANAGEGSWQQTRWKKS